MGNEEEEDEEEPCVGNEMEWGVDQDKVEWASLYEFLSADSLLQIYEISSSPGGGISSGVPGLSVTNSPST